MVLIIVMGVNVIVFFHGGVSLLTGIAQYYICKLRKPPVFNSHLGVDHCHAEIQG